MKELLSKLFSPTNEFFLLAKDSKRLTHISLSSFILPVVFLIIAGVLTQFVFAPLTIGQAGESLPWIRDIFGLFVMFGTGSIIVFLWVLLFEGRPVYTLGFTRTKAFKKYFSGFVIGILMNSAVVAIMALFGTIEIAEESSNITGFNALGIVLLFLFGFMVQGASEEILSRGWMLQVIGKRYKPLLGVIISTTFFTIVHLGNSGINIPSILNLILVSILLCLFVMNDGSLWFACAWHSSWNWIMGNVYGLSVSGSGEKVTILDLNTTGNELVSGGGFGPEGSLVTTFVIIIGIIIFAIKLINKNNLEQVTNGTISFN
ncbi:MAG: CPBP family intramembrane metalloprotease [Melioribacteraceae bacterium]|nr:CPBP family intramembrane metalloprotease [Melioribacteraceae bacterium]